MLSQQAISEFKKVYYKTFGMNIYNQDAIEQGMKLLQLFKIIYQPISEECEKYKKREVNKK